MKRSGDASDTNIPEEPKSLSALPDGILDRLGSWICAGILAAMVLLIGTELLLRNFANISWQGTDQFSGYMLVSLTFISASVSLASGNFHEVTVLRDSLSARASAILAFAVYAVCLLFSLILAWQFIRFGWRTWNFGELSSVGIRFPLWIPRLGMIVGVIMINWTLMRILWSLARRISRG